MALSIGDSGEELGVLLVTDLDRETNPSHAGRLLVDVDTHDDRLATEVVSQQLEAACAIDADLKHARACAAKPPEMAMVDREVVRPLVERTTGSMAAEVGEERITR